MKTSREINIIQHVVNPLTKNWYHVDSKYNLWSCNCDQPEEKRVSLCLSISPLLEAEGEYNDIRRKVAEKRKELQLLESMTIKDIEQFKKH